MDIDAASIQEATCRYGINAKFLQGDMACLNFATASFDLVCCLEGIEHVPVEIGSRFLSETARVSVLMASF